ncbi:putative DUF28-containing protein [Staphylococcus aureus]|uniref:Putative DUF28-containing protein n=1 Tax=Staphylococcus aureus TaxID=1280 RepID=A0A380DLE8_STAAU|nr:putative DUF28-containing protein [Staphylococcus aureus]
MYLDQLLICLIMWQTFGIEGKSVDEILETLMEQDVDVNDVIDDNGLTIVLC